MHIKVRSRGTHFGMHWEPANVALTLMLVLLFVIFLLLFMALAAPPAMGQMSGCRLPIVGCSCDGCTPGLLRA